MKYYFDEKALLARDRTEIRDEEGRMRYWGIYDFSYKWRIRIFNEDDAEIGYVQYRIGSDETAVDLCGAISDSLVEKDGKVHVLGSGKILDDSGIEGTFRIDGNEMEIDDEKMLSYSVFCLFGYAQYMESKGESE